jgi:23S rRNA (adenine2503-C2)-methyltransferase
MGESLANFENLIPALDRICAPAGLGLGQRRVTISTVGLPEKIHRLAALDRQYHLAVSLHAPTEALRDELVPINAKVGLKAVVAAADAYFQRSGRQVTFEYVLLGGVNDRAEEARALADLLAARKAHVNVIPYNPVEGLPFERPSPVAIQRFVETVRARGVSISVRKTKGRAIDAACGQLRRQLEQHTQAVGAARVSHSSAPA